MKLAICTTTINGITPALRKFVSIADRLGAHIFVAGDTKTPEDEHRKMAASNSGYHYVNLDEQRSMAVELSDAIGPNCIQRRNFAMLAAYRAGADIMAMVDDDNIPLSTWGQNITVGQETGVVTIPADNGLAFDPLVVHRNLAFPSDLALHHRGYPVQLNRVEAKRETIIPLVQADFWLGEPDVDASMRIAAGGELNVSEYPGLTGFFRGSLAGPFNSQNTFIHRSLLPVYFLFGGIGRMDDIWASYIVQAVVPDAVVYGPASVTQERNPHDLSKDLEAEMIGYLHTIDLVEWLRDNDPMADPFPAWFPMDSQNQWVLWKDAIHT